MLTIIQTGSHTDKHMYRHIHTYILHIDTIDTLHASCITEVTCDDGYPTFGPDNQYCCHCRYKDGSGHSGSCEDMDNGCICKEGWFDHDKYSLCQYSKW